MVAKQETVSDAEPPRTPRLTERRRGGTQPDRSPRQNHALISAVTHEIRSPLTVIRANSSVALQQKARLTVRQMVELMQGIESSVRMVEIIIEDLETLSKHEAIRMRPQLLDLAAFLTELAPDLQALAPGRRLELLLRAQPVWLRADPTRLKQILTNLVENAHKHSSAGGQISVQIAQAEQETLIAVEDAGPGVPTEDLEQFFQPFYRSARSAEVRGSGLGLAICKGLVEAQGGQIQAAMVPGRGFRVMMTFLSATG